MNTDALSIEPLHTFNWTPYANWNEPGRGQIFIIEEEEKKKKKNVIFLKFFFGKSH